LKKITEKYPIPENCPNLCVPRLNEEVYANIENKDALARDKATQRTRQLLATAAVPILSVMQSLVDNDGKVTPSECLAMAGDALKLVATAFNTLSNRRRDAIRPALSKEYTQLCSSSNPVTDQLLGSDLQAQIKTINETQKLKITKDKVQWRQRGATNSHYKRNRGGQQNGQNYYQGQQDNYFQGYNNYGYGQNGQPYPNSNKRGGGGGRGACNQGFKKGGNQQQPFLGWGQAGQQHNSSYRADKKRRK
jgi:hypothetical protein